MIPIKATCLTLFAAVGFALGLSLSPTQAQPPSVVHADADYDASGYVTPAGMVPPSMYQGSALPLGMSSGVMPVGFNGPVDCDGGGNNGMFSGGMLGGGGCQNGYCEGGCENGECGEDYDAGIFGRRARCRLLGGRGFAANMTACGGCAHPGCRACGGLTNTRFFCMFCRGGGCEACQFLGRGYLLGAIGSLLPYQDAGRGAQRWYDLSAEALFLSHSTGNGSGVVTTQGVSGTPVLSIGDADSDDLEAGMRLSAAMIFGAGGNLEFTYMGGQEWDSTATVNDPTAQLYSVISDFGVTPAGGYDDTDQSLSQSLGNQSEFDSFELNYRRRTVGPYNRFQGSWLVGLRHIRYNDRLIYSAIGLDNNGVGGDRRFFTSSDRNKNRLFGPQAGFDLWYNVMPGINLGFGLKGAWMQNDVKRDSFLAFNSEAPLATPGSVEFNDTDQDSTVMGEFETTLLYRLSHSWTVRSSYYLIGIDEVRFGAFDSQNIRNFAAAVPSTPPNANRAQTDNLVIQGFSVGAEYIW
ncbi:hypothetical protein [Novipirellula galeiformis]|nr:hypothetical protein [Novipirellula galeiformis]